MARKAKIPPTITNSPVAQAERALAEARANAANNARATLRDAASHLAQGHAYTLCELIAEGNGGHQDDDTLFRVLILEHSYSVTDAQPIYEAAAQLLAAPAGF